MGDLLAGPGQGLPWPQALYPPLLWTTPFTAPTNRFKLQAGNALRIPAGTWIVEAGDVSRLQWLDPVERQWNNLVRSPAIGMADIRRHWGTTIRSDGFNFRLANVSGVALSASVTNGGANYLHATTHVVAATGDSRWRAIVGGQLGAVEIIEPGANFTLPPLCFVPAPPFPGVCATGSVTIGAPGTPTAGQVVSITWNEPGAGYPFPPNVLLVPDPFEPMLLEIHEHERRRDDLIRPAKVRVHLTGHGAVSAVLLEHFGQALPAPPALTISGQGTGATAAVDLPSTGWIAPVEDEVTIQPASGP